MTSEQFERRRWWIPLLGGFVHGLCVYLSLPPVGAWPLTFVSAVVVVWVASSERVRAGRAALWFGLGTLPLWASEEAWLVTVTPLGTPLLAMYLAVCSGMTVYVLAVIRRGWGCFPPALAAGLAWLAVEFFRGEVMFTGYGWFLLAHPVIDAPVLAGPAGVLGVYFVSFLIAATAGAVVDLIVRGDGRRWRAAAAMVGIAVVWAGMGALGPHPVVGREGRVRVGVVQTNVPQSNKLAWTAERIAVDFQRFIQLTRELAKADPKPDVIVWPETMFPGVSLNDRAVEVFEGVFRANKMGTGGTGEKEEGERSLNAAMVDILKQTQVECGIPFLIGSNEVGGARLERDGAQHAVLGHDAKHNSVVVIDHGQVLGAGYEKVDLMPFGEVIPYIWRWPMLQGLVLELGAGGMKFDLAPGTRVGPVDLPGVYGFGQVPVSAVTPICFEVTRSSLCRRLANGEAGGREGGRVGLIINLSNDGWFGDVEWSPVPSDAGRAQHLLAARWRCVELGLPMVRAVNTGVSCAVDCGGQLLTCEAVDGLRRAARADGALVATVPIGGGSIFRRVGNVFGWSAMSAGWVLFAGAWWKGRRGRKVVE